MSAADEIDPNASLYDWLAHDLRFYRKKHGLTGAEVGKIIGCVRSHVANLEAGRARLDLKQARALDTAWETGGHFERLLLFAGRGHDPDWFRQSTVLEGQSRVLRIYQGQVVPVLFQTEDYARVFLSGARVKNVEEALRGRLARQKLVLERPDPPLIIALLDQELLERLIGGTKVMREQLQRLLELGECPNIIVRIIPRSVGWHLGLNGPFQVMGLTKRDAAYIGAFHGGRLVQDPVEAQDMAIDFELIGAKALSEEDSRVLIEKLKEGYA